MTIKISLTFLAGLAFCSGATATTANNPYQSIVTRNVFGLKDPLPPPIVEPVKLAPKLTLTGILTFGKTRALMKAPPVPPKPGEQPKGEQYFTLGEGERDGDVQVVSIDPRLGKVILKIGGEVLTLGFEENSKSKGGPAGTGPAPLAGFSPGLAPQRLPTPGIPQPPQPPQVAEPVPALANAPGPAVPSETPEELTTQASAAVDARPAAAENPYTRGRAIPYPAIDPTPGAVQTRTPFPTRSLRGRGPAAYRTMPTAGSAADAQPPTLPQ